MHIVYFYIRLYSFYGPCGPEIKLYYYYIIIVSSTLPPFSSSLVSPLLFPDPSLLHSLPILAVKAWIFVIHVWFWHLVITTHLREHRSLDFVHFALKM